MDESELRILLLSALPYDCAVGPVRFYPLERNEGVMIDAAAVEAADCLRHGGVVLLQENAGSVTSGGPVPAVEIIRRIPLETIHGGLLATHRIIVFEQSPEEAVGSDRPVIPLHMIREADFAGYEGLPADHPLKMITKLAQEQLEATQLPKA